MRCLRCHVLTSNNDFYVELCVGGMLRVNPRHRRPRCWPFRSSCAPRRTSRRGTCAVRTARPSPWSASSGFRAPAVLRRAADENPTPPFPPPPSHPIPRVCRAEHCPRHANSDTTGAAVRRRPTVAPVQSGKREEKLSESSTYERCVGRRHPSRANTKRITRGR